MATYLLIAVLAPLLSFFVILCFGPRMGKAAAYVATLAIALACVLSFVTLFNWLDSHPLVSSHGDSGHVEAGEHGGDGEHEDAGDSHHWNCV